MNSKRKPLGRNLDALLGERRGQKSADSQLRHLPVDLIQPGRYQPRSIFDEDKLSQLADSIRAQGVVQPVVVRPLADGQFELIAGERRWRAAQQAGLDQVPAVVREIDDERAVAMSLIENIQREDLNPLEEAAALQRLVEEFGLTHQQAAEAVGRSRSAVSNLLRLLELAQGVKDMVDARHLEMGHARALLSLDSELQTRAAREVVTKQLTVRQTEALVRKLQQGNVLKGARRPVDPDIMRLEGELAETLCAQVKIQHRAGGKGRLSISYNSVEELEGILERIR